MKRALIIAGVCIILVVIVCGQMNRTPTIDWACTEYDAPYRVVLITTYANVYSGITQPDPSMIKGHVTGGAGGVEAMCSKPSSDTFLRLRGVDWWGWLREVDTH